MKTLLIVVSILLSLSGIFGDDLKSAAVDNHAATSIERTAKFNP